MQNKKLYQTIIFDIFNVLIKSEILLSFGITAEQKNNILYTPIVGGIYLLNQCAEQNYTLYALSNAKQKVIDKLCQQFSDIFSLFNHIVISECAGFAKPDQRIFNYLLSKYHLDPATCIFIDDNQNNIVTAEILGITGIHYINANQVERNLKNLNVL